MHLINAAKIKEDSSYTLRIRNYKKAIEKKNKEFNFHTKKTITERNTEKGAGVATKVVRKIKMQKWKKCAKSFGKHLTRTQVIGYKIFKKLKWK
jgi:hypothetical protein